ncbi:hypothetical protein PCC7424_2929 [Gloeothece citriformis PCC 7424]|uniref:Beta-lactamase class A catalytic domain-containing protein n=2 Tax=Gloeothece TaxID=28070 RepID=B7K9X7_GLOC7|nr:hypothetical protein PCC7424_2929 [Gloeothece citriformis PCC 7424]
MKIKLNMKEIKFLIISTSMASLFVLAGLAITKNSDQKLKSSETIASPSPQISHLPQQPETPLTSVQTSPNLPPLPPKAINSSHSQEIVYLTLESPTFQKNQSLQKIVDQIVQYAADKKYPINPLSITLINVKTGQYGEYQQDRLRYPASVVKLFWMVALYGQIASGKWQDPQIFAEDLRKMMIQSDNEAASRIVNQLTDTQSGNNLTDQDYKQWLYKRQWLNRFFEYANYKNINISQKTFPIPSEKLFEPKGLDLKMRGNPNKPIRNKISTEQAARLMYEIVTGNAISKEYSENMMFWLDRNELLSSGEWKEIDPNTGYFNPIQGFLGEYFSTLSHRVYFASKAGWTGNTRQEVAYINDGKVAYILAIFAEDTAYAQNWQIFPKISEIVYTEMTN